MVTDMVVAIIPARGGSKTIPRKNMKLLGGFPLIAYSIAAALAARQVNRVIVSTDDEDIASVAREWGAEVPFLRPSKYAQDHTPDLPVFQHALRWLAENEGVRPEIIVQLRPTSPFRRVTHIEQAIKLLQGTKKADSVRTVCTPFQNPFKMWTIQEDGFLAPLIQGYGKEPYNMPRQQLPAVWWQTGYVDVTRWQTIMSLQSMTGQQILPLRTEDYEWVDIDSETDWRAADLLLETDKVNSQKLGFNLKKRNLSVVEN